MSVETYEDEPEEHIANDLPADDEVDDFGDTEDDRARARTMGWKPFGTSRVPREEFQSAREFIRRGEASLPILRKNNRDLTARLARAEGDLSKMKLTVAEQKEALEAAMALARRADNAGYQRALRELKTQQRQAATNGDTEAFDQVTEQIEALETERERVTQEPAPKPTAPAPSLPDHANPQHPAYAAFHAANPWIHSDQELREEMIDQHNRVIRRNPHMSLEEQLERARAQVVKAYPAKFADEIEQPEPDEEEEEVDQPPRRQTAAAVQRPRTTQAPPPRRRQVGFDTIADPAEREDAKKAYASLKRQYPDYTVEEYMQVYNDPRGDILEQLNRKK